jgi:hypothetical protein
MAARSTIVINDGAATPVAHTFSPQVGGDLSLYKDRSVTIEVGQPYVTVEMTKPQAGDNEGYYKCRLRVCVPSLAAVGVASSGVTPASQVAYRELAVMEFSVSRRASLQEKKDTLAFAANLLGHQVAKDLVWNQELPW